MNKHFEVLTVLNTRPELYKQYVSVTSLGLSWWLKHLLPPSLVAFVATFIIPFSLVSVWTLVTTASTCMNADIRARFVSWDENCTGTKCRVSLITKWISADTLIIRLLQFSTAYCINMHTFWLALLQFCHWFFEGFCFHYGLCSPLQTVGIIAI